MIADNLSTTATNVIDCRNAALSLSNDEYATSFSLILGTAKSGFIKVAEPQVLWSSTHPLVLFGEARNVCCHKRKNARPAHVHGRIPRRQDQWGVDAATTQF
ncbi:MAG: hypothetical protein LBU32_16415 [Clostridiales bacterium]|jgi:hypothetical protein|nr:hypothetical protein [Clostridiales bacterium]